MASVGTRWLSAHPRCTSHSLELSLVLPAAWKLPAPHPTGGQGQGSKIHRGCILPLLSRQAVFAAPRSPEPLPWACRAAPAALHRCRGHCRPGRTAQRARSSSWGRWHRGGEAEAAPKQMLGLHTTENPSPWGTHAGGTVSVTPALPPYPALLARGTQLSSGHSCPGRAFGQISPAGWK